MMKTELKESVLKALDEIRPFLASDGGDISLVGIEENRRVKVTNFTGPVFLVPSIK